MKITSKIILMFIGLGIVNNSLVAMSIDELLSKEPRRLQVKRGWVPGVKVLDLSNMGIDSLKGLENIPGIESVTRLYLDHNTIETIESGDFAATIKLRALGLSSNGLATIEPNAFAGLKNLKVLDLSNNSIETVSQESFNGLAELRFLGMSKNPMSNPKGTLQSQVPKAFITTLPVTKENIKKWSAIVGAGVAALVGAILAKKKIHERRLEKFKKDYVAWSQKFENDLLLEEAKHGSLFGVKYHLDPFMTGGKVDGVFYPGPIADINARDKDDNTALMIAASNGHKEVVTFLLEKGATVNLLNKYGESALDKAKNKEIKELLKRAQDTSGKE